MNRLLPVALSLLALLATACPEENNARGPDAALPGLDAAAEAPDAEAMPPDAAAPGPDAAPVAPPLRTLVEPHLMGTAPIDNLVMAPNFDPMSEQWYAATGGMSLADAWLVVPTRTPVNGLPVFKILAGEEEHFLVGTVRGGAAPLQASVWLGRDIGITVDPGLLQVVVQGLPASGVTDDYFLLLAETDSETTIDRITWTRYSGTIDSTLLGFGSFIVDDQTQQALYVQAPTIIQVAETKGLIKARPSIRKKPTAAQAKAVKTFWDWQHKKAPPKRLKP